jgi:hypothetical protein
MIVRMVYPIWFWGLHSSEMLLSVASQSGEDLIYTAVEAWNQSGLD